MCHALNRGDQREDIFLDDEDRHKFLAALVQACLKTDSVPRGMKPGCKRPNALSLRDCRPAVGGKKICFQRAKETNEKSGWRGASEGRPR